MPLVPTGLGRRWVNRVVDRVNQEMGRPVEQAKSFYERVKQRTQDQLHVGPTNVGPSMPWEQAVHEPTAPQEKEIPPQPPVAGNLQEIKSRIAAAGRRMVMLRMKYHGHARNVEPYSIRDGRAADDGDLFYGWCHKDNALESFRLDRIEDIQITNIPFTPRNNWPVEF